MKRSTFLALSTGLKLHADWVGVRRYVGVCLYL